MNSKKTERLSMRLPVSQKERLETAAVAERRTLTNFVLAAALDRADIILGKKELDDS